MQSLLDMKNLDFSRSVLLKILAKYAYKYQPGGFKLSSGQDSDDYLDCKQALSHPLALPALGSLILNEAASIFPPANAIGGLTMGADAIAISTSMLSLTSLYSSMQPEGKPLKWFSVRKTPKGHGTQKHIEGDVRDKENVIIVDDVVTTGNSTIEAIQKCRQADLNIVQVVVLVDREQGGLMNIAHQVSPVHAIFTKSQIHAEYRALQAFEEMTL